MIRYIRHNIYPLIALLCIALNHLYTHCVVLDDTKLGVVWMYRAFTFVCFDLLSILLVCGALTLFRKRRIAYTITWLLMLVLDIANIGYSRFFHQYFSPDSLQELGNLSGMWWAEFVLPACRVSDLFLLLTSVIFVIVVWTPKPLRKYIDIQQWNKRLNWKANILAILVIVLPHTAISDAFNAYQHEFPDSVGAYLSATQGDEFHHRVVLEQKLYYCAYGLVRTQLFFAAFYPTNDKPLTPQDEQAISSFLKAKHEQPIYPDCFALPKQSNISMIIVESYLSVLSDMKVNGIEVTPNLNKIRHTEGTYYNGNMHSSIALGESSDAQLMYFTGLLPLKSEITVAKLPRKHIPALPSLLHSQKKYNTYMTIPTKKYVWHQDEANTAYGIDQLYSTLDETDGFLGEDDDVINLAIKKEQTMKQPFMHVILTASMHSPYTSEKKYSKSCPLQFPADYSKEYCNYLRACWFMDTQLGAYIHHLKQTGRYDNTILIIAADHESHPELLNTPATALANCAIPLYIVNAGIKLPSDSNDTIEQIDIYSSLLDLFGINTHWRGLGQSIFRPRQQHGDEYIKKRSEISDLIINGDWLKNK